MKRLAKLYLSRKVIEVAHQMYSFVHGFNDSHALCEYVDAGGSKGCSDKKLGGNWPFGRHGVNQTQRKNDLTAALSSMVEALRD